MGGSVLFISLGLYFLYKSRKAPNRPSYCDRTCVFIWFSRSEVSYAGATFEGCSADTINFWLTVLLGIVKHHTVLFSSKFRTLTIRWGIACKNGTEWVSPFVNHHFDPQIRPSNTDIALETYEWLRGRRSKVSISWKSTQRGRDPFEISRIPTSPRAFTSISLFLCLSHLVFAGIFSHFFRARNSPRSPLCLFPAMLHDILVTTTE